MPELPEIEILCAGIKPYALGNVISKCAVYNNSLRWPISPELIGLLQGQTIKTISRRGKYLLFNCDTGCLLIHLGMTGTLRVLPHFTMPGKHDHFDIIFNNQITVRFNDVRRFGSVQWIGLNLQKHKLLSDLGPEPLTNNFNGLYFYTKSRTRKVIVKQFIMDHKIVAGIGNIYANEALFLAGIQPKIPVGQLSKNRCRRLVESIKSILSSSIIVGGTMLDFRDGNERVGAFTKHLRVYKRNGEPCHICGSAIKYERIGMRSIYYCENCQR